MTIPCTKAFLIFHRKFSEINSHIKIEFGKQKTGFAVGVNLQKTNQQSTQVLTIQHNFSFHVSRLKPMSFNSNLYTICIKIYQHNGQDKNIEKDLLTGFSKDCFKLRVFSVQNLFCI